MGRGCDYNCHLSEEKAEHIRINGLNFVIDKDGVVYDLHMEEPVGIYNCEKKEWIVAYYLETEDITIDGVEYWIKEDGVVYNKKIKKVGVYDREKNEWITQHDDLEDEFEEFMIDGDEYLIDEDGL